MRIKKFYDNPKALKYAQEMQKNYGLNARQFKACYREAEIKIKKHKPLHF